MIPGHQRIADLGCSTVSGELQTYGVIDFDRRRFLNVSIPTTAAGFKQDDGGGDVPTAVSLCGHALLNQLCDELEQDVCAITVDPDKREVLDKTHGPDTYCLGACWPHYPTPAELGLPSRIKRLKRSQLLELSRLRPSADLVSFKTESGHVQRGIFTYFFARDDVQPHLREQQVLLHVGRHPNLPEYLRAVLDDSGQVIVGYLAKYLSLETVMDNVRFDLSLLQQLIRVVDDMNLKYGFIHGDITPDRILVDEATNTLQLDNMSCAKPITVENAMTDVVMATTAVYHIITRRTLFTGWGVPLQQFAILLPRLQDIADWSPHPEIELDHDVTAYTLLLQDWAASRLNRPNPLPEQDPLARVGGSMTARKRKPQSHDDQPQPKRIRSGSMESSLTKEGGSPDPETLLPPAPKQFRPRPILKPILLPSGRYETRDLLTLSPSALPHTPSASSDPHDPIVQWSRPSEAQRLPGVFYLANGEPADEDTVEELLAPPSPEGDSPQAVDDEGAEEPDVPNDREPSPDLTVDITHGTQDNKDNEAPDTHQPPDNNSNMATPAGPATPTSTTTTTAATLAVAAAAATAARAEAATDAAHSAARMALDAADAANAAAQAARAASEAAARAAAAVETASAVAEEVLKRGG